MTHHVGIENEVHNFTRCTRSSGIRGGSQSVVLRIESYHAFKSAIVCWRLGLRRGLAEGLEARARGFCCASQSSSAEASVSERPCTFLRRVPRCSWADNSLKGDGFTSSLANAKGPKLPVRHSLLPTTRHRRYRRSVRPDGHGAEREAAGLSAIKRQGSIFALGGGSTTFIRMSTLSPPG